MVHKFSSKTINGDPHGMCAPKHTPQCMAQCVPVLILISYQSSAFAAVGFAFGIRTSLAYGFYYRNFSVFSLILFNFSLVRCIENRERKKRAAQLPTECISFFHVQCKNDVIYIYHFSSHVLSLSPSLSLAISNSFSHRQNEIETVFGLFPSLPSTYCAFKRSDCQVNAMMVKIRLASIFPSNPRQMLAHPTNALN